MARQLLYPTGHLYGVGLADAIKVDLALKTSDLSALHHRLVAADDVTAVATGDSDLDSVTSMFERGLGALTGHVAKRAAIPAAPPPARTLVVLSEAGLRQDKVVLRFMGVPLDHPDFPALEVAARVIVAAAYDRIRIGHGTTYGVRMAGPAIPP